MCKKRLSYLLSSPGLTVLQKLLNAAASIVRTRTEIIKGKTFEKRNAFYVFMDPDNELFVLLFKFRSYMLYISITYNPPATASHVQAIA